MRHAPRLAPPARVPAPWRSLASLPPRAARAAVVCATSAALALGAGAPVAAASTGAQPWTTAAPATSTLATAVTSPFSAYVTAVYQHLFGRVPDQAGLDLWTAALTRGTPRIAVANAITASDEYRGRLITRSYERYLDRRPDPQGLTNWLAVMAAGSTIQSMESGFIASSEYYTRAGGNDANWVRAMYRDVLGRSAGRAEVDAWTASLRRGASRATAAMGFLLSSEHLTTVIDAEYVRLLGRSIDPTGRATWVSVIQGGGRLEAVVGGIIASDEYVTRSAQSAPDSGGTPPPDSGGTPPPDPVADPTFTLAVIPDTQQDVFSDRILNRGQWLVRNRDALDLEFVLHTGDVVNWDTPDHSQYADASNQLKVLDDAQIPTALTIGNHDTYAVGEGGSARDPRLTRAYVRDTRTFNTYFPPSRYGVEGTFEPGKIDNNFQLFTAGGLDWMIVTLELWPRAEAVQWAKDVVAAHPDHNVLVMTHAYLEADGAISARSDYGVTSPQSLFDGLISAYPNVRMVFSGHEGYGGASRTDTGVHGNTIASYMGAYHSNTRNPIRLVEIDTARGTVNTRVYSPNNDETMVGDELITGLAFD